MLIAHGSNFFLDGRFNVINRGILVLLVRVRTDAVESLCALQKLVQLILDDSPSLLLQTCFSAPLLLSPPDLLHTLPKSRYHQAQSCHFLERQALLSDEEFAISHPIHPI